MAALPVVDLEWARWFYGKLLGLYLCQESIERGELVYQVGEGSHLVVYQRSASANTDHIELAFMVDDIESTVNELREKGIAFEEYNLPGVVAQHGIVQLNGEKVAWFKDPEGNLLAIAENREAWRAASGECTRPRTQSMGSVA